MNQSDCKQEEHFYLNEDGCMVFTEKHHLARGYCCGLGCRHCPYQHINVPVAKSTEKRNENETAD
jgi:hypothetical protein